MSGKPPNSILVTGAAGMVGTALRHAWPKGGERVVFSDIRPAPPVRPNERLLVGDLADRAFMDRLVEGVDAVVHLGGISKERGWAELSHGNIEGTYTLYEAARKAGVRRIVYASSLHVTGYYSVDEMLESDALPRPSTLYGVTKAFGEALARLYWDKFGVEGLVIRLGTFGPRPGDARALRTWMSERDLIDLIETALAIERLQFQQVYGVSNNSLSWWTNPATMLGGWRLQDSADAFIEAIGGTALESSRPEGRFQGGAFTAVGHFDDGAPTDPALAPVFGLPLPTTDDSGDN